MGCSYSGPSVLSLVSEVRNQAPNGGSVINLHKLRQAIDATDNSSSKSGQLNECDHQGMTPLHWVAYRTGGGANSIEAAQLLLAKSETNRDAVDHDGLTALHFAADHDEYRMIEILLQGGANPTIVDLGQHSATLGKGFPPSGWARSPQCRKILKDAEKNWAET